MLPDRLPRNKEDLLREVDLGLRLGDIQRSHRLKDLLAPKWWETGVVMLLFISSLGLLASLVQYSNLKEGALQSWMLFWFTLTLLTIVFTFEFLLVKIYNLRRSNDILLRMIEDLRKQQDEVLKRLDKLSAAPGE